MNRIVRSALALLAISLPLLVVWLLPAHAEVPVIEGLAMADVRFGVGAPIVQGGVAVFPIVDAQAPDTPDAGIATLAEGLEAETLAITEREGGDVPTLQVVNAGKEPVLLTAGEVVQGGKQDRVVVSDVLIPADGKAHDVPVNCVEQSRWSYTGEAKFGYGGRAETALKETVQVAKDQGRTWETVAALNAMKAPLVTNADAVAPNTGTYMASLDNPELAAKTDAAAKALEQGLTAQAKVVGLVIAYEGQLAAAEMFGQPSLFDKARPSIVDSVALESLGKKAASAPSQQAAASFLATALAEHAAPTVKAGEAQRSEVEVDDRKVFKTTTESGDLLHLDLY